MYKNFFKFSYNFLKKREIITKKNHKFIEYKSSLKNSDDIIFKNQEVKFLINDFHNEVNFFVKLKDVDYDILCFKNKVLFSFCF